MRVNLPLKSIGFGRYRPSPNIYLFFKHTLTFSKGSSRYLGYVIKNKDADDQDSINLKPGEKRKSSSGFPDASLD